MKIWIIAIVFVLVVVSPVLRYFLKRKMEKERGVENQKDIIKKGITNMTVLIPSVLTVILLSGIAVYRIHNNIKISIEEYILDGAKIYGLIIILEAIIGVIIALLNPLFKGNTNKTITFITSIIIALMIGFLLIKEYWR